MADYYRTLGVERGADEQTIRKAYRKLAMEYHPDRRRDDPQAEKKFKEINEAYAALKDPQKRAAYDRYGSEGLKDRGFEGFSGGFGGFDINLGGFEDFFGVGGGRARSKRGADLSCDVTISLDEAFSGVSRTVNKRAPVTCGICGGNGLAPGASPERCPQCNGSGRNVSRRGPFTIEQTCPHCGGRGEMVKNPCQTCKGSGQVMQSSKEDVEIPPGIADNMRIRLQGRGGAGREGAPPGDLYVTTHIRGHEVFRRAGNDLHIEVPIPMTVAALGGKVEVPTVDGGKIELTIPEGIQSGEKLRMRNMGMPMLNNPRSRGNLIADIKVETPAKLSPGQRELLEQFAASGDWSHSPRSKGFLQRLKDLINA